MLRMHADTKSISNMDFLRWGEFYGRVMCCPDSGSSVFNLREDPLGYKRSKVPLPFSFTRTFLFQTTFEADTNNIYR